MLRFPILVLFVAALTGCATQARSDLLDSTLRAYASAIRWGNFNDAIAFIDPQVMKEHPPTQLDLDRYAQVRILDYVAQTPLPGGKDEVRQTVAISLINNNTQSLRNITDRQVWRYDAKSKHWWLTTGLPDITQH